MIAWITANLGNIIVSLVLIVIVALTIRSLIKARKKGSCSCGGECGCCPMAGKCH